MGNVYSSLFILLTFSAIPLLLAAAASFMGWLYWHDFHRREHHAPSPESQPGTAGPLRDGSQLRLISADASADLDPAADQVLKDARDVTARVRFAYLVSALAYAALSTAFLVQAATKQILEAAFVQAAAKRILETAPVQAFATQTLVLVPTAANQILEAAFVQVVAKHVLGAVLIMSYLILAPQIVVVARFIRMSFRQRLSTFLAYSLIGSLLLLAMGPDRILRRFAALITPPYGPLSFLATPIGVFVICPLIGLYFLLARRTQPLLALLAASLLYIGGGALPFVFMSRPVIIDEVSRRPWLISVGLTNLVLGVILAGKLLRLLPRSSRMFGLATLAVVVLAIVGGRMPLHGAALVLVILSGTAGSVLVLLFVWAVFKVFVWLREQGHWLTPEILDAHVCWTCLTLFLLVSAWQLRALGLFSASGLVFSGCVAALAIHLALLHTLLGRVRSWRPSRASKRLLLLRVFGRGGEPEDLLDTLDNTWRRIGAIDLFGSLTPRTSVLEAFLLRRGADQFLKTDEEVDKRLSDLRSEIEGDARYPVNGVYCYINTWQRAFVHLAQDAAAVLMDLRSFTSENTGSAWELDYLVKHIPLRRILLLVDGDTDRRELIEQKAQAAWTHLPLDSPNTSDQKPELKYLIYHRRSEADRHKLSRLLLIAAGDSTATCTGDPCGGPELRQPRR